MKSLLAKPDPPYPPNTYIFEPMRVTECPPLRNVGIIIDYDDIYHNITLKTQRRIALTVIIAPRRV